MNQLTNTDLKILDTAREMFLERGIIKTDMKDIAKELGCSRSTLYRHFANKGDILIILAANALNTISSSTHLPKDLTFHTGLDEFTWELDSMTECLISHPDDLTFLRDFDSLYAKEYPSFKSNATFEVLVANSSQTNRMLESFNKGIADKSIAYDETPELTVLSIIHGIIGLAQRVMPAEQHYSRNFGYGKELLRQTEKLYLEAIRNKSSIS